jgi:hypothetical protein
VGSHSFVLRGGKEEPKLTVVRGNNGGHLFRILEPLRRPFE